MVGPSLTLDRLRAVLSYDEATGKFHWLRPHRHIKPGVEAGTVNVHGHRSIRIDGRSHYAHRLAWFYAYGVWPLQQIDHINGLKDDNRIVNLRDVEQCINMQNLHGPTKKNQGLKLLGVSYDPRSKRYRSKIRINGRQTHIGSFPDAEQAATAYLEAKRIHHPGCTI